MTTWASNDDLTISDDEIDYLHVSLGHYKATSMRDQNDKRIIGSLLVEKINGRKPLIGVGSIRTREDIEDALNNVRYNLIAVARPIVTESNRVRKIKTGETVRTYVDMENPKAQHIPLKMAKAVTKLQFFNEG